MKKKIFAFGLAAAMSVTAVGLMAGCGDRVSDGSTISVAVAREASSGTREVFEEKVSKNGVSIADWLDEEGNAMPGEISEFNSTSGVITQVAQSYDRLGYISLGSLAANADSVQAVTVNGVAATKENVQSGDYSIWRNFNIVYTPAELEGNDLLQNFISFIESAAGQTVINESYIQLPGLEVKEYTPYAGTQTSLSCSGSTSVAPLMRELAAAFSEANGGKITVNVQEGGSGVGIQQATNGTVDFGMSSREITATEDEQLDAEAICMDGVAVIVKKGSKCTAVTLEQLFDLYTALTPIVTEA